MTSQKEKYSSASRVLEEIRNVEPRSSRPILELNNVSVTTKKGKQLEMVNVNVFDDTAEITLTLWPRAASSASSWTPSHTILLLTKPGFKDDRRPTITLERKTHVDVDPCMADAEWLRNFAQRLTRREHVNPPFPENSTQSVICRIGKNLDLIATSVRYRTGYIRRSENPFHPG